MREFLWVPQCVGNANYAIRIRKLCIIGTPSLYPINMFQKYYNTFVPYAVQVSIEQTGSECLYRYSTEIKGGLCVSLFNAFSGGVHPAGNKNTEQYPTVRLVDFDKVEIPMSMHIGIPCRCVVSPGDEVKIGQMIGEAGGYLSAPIHASISGTVKSVAHRVAASGRKLEVVEIESDGRHEPFEEITPPVVETREDFIQAIRDSGLVGLGGAGFPTHVKLSPPPNKQPDVLLINAAECEPYITADYRQTVEHPDEIIDGILQVMKWMEIPKAIIGVEDNKPIAIELLNNALLKYQVVHFKKPPIEVVPLRTLFPQGAEKMLIYTLTRRKVPTGGLPHDVGTLVLNVSTVRFISKYLETGMPLIRRRVTLDGSALSCACNVNDPTAHGGREGDGQYDPCRQGGIDDVVSHTAKHLLHHHNGDERSDNDYIYRNGRRQVECQKESRHNRAHVPDRIVSFHGASAQILE